jgi:uncharacterized delta-60 repeat protein
MKAGRFVAAAVLAAVGMASLAATATAAPAPGDLDLSFGNQGLLWLPQSSTGASSGLIGEDMAVGPEGEIFVLQGQYTCGSSDCTRRLSLQRFGPDGVPDVGFGTDGSSDALSVVSNQSFPHNASLAVGGDGRPVVAANDDGDITLARFNRDGGLDPSFGTNGMVTTDFGGDESGPQVAVRPDGEIVMAGASSFEAFGLAYTVLAGYLPTGALDPSFGSGSAELGGSGWLRIPGGVVARALSLSNEGDIALAGDRCCGASSKAVYLDYRDGNGGLRGPRPATPWQRLKVGPGASVSAVVALPNGRTYLVGSTTAGGFAAKVLASGEPDPRYGRAGVTRLSAFSVRGPGPVAAVDNKGRLLVVGSVRTDELTSESLAARRLPSGRPDRTWAGGLLHLDNMGTPLALALQPSGHAVVFGEGPDECIRYCSGRTRALLGLVGGSSRSRCMGRRATIVGTRRGETLVGTRHRDVIAALGGADTVRGRGGNDLICGGPGRDKISGGPGHDRTVQ